MTKESVRLNEIIKDIAFDCVNFTEVLNLLNGSADSSDVSAIRAMFLSMSSLLLNASDMLDFLS